MSTTILRLCAGLGALGLLAGHGAAQCTPGCSAQGNATLTAPSQVLPGSSLSLSVTGARSSMPALIGVSAGSGPVCLPWGKICLSAPILTVAGSTPLNISTVLPAGTPAKTALHLQGFVVDAAAPNGFVALSKSHTLTAQPGLMVYSDAGLNDQLGTFQGGGGSIRLAEIKSAMAPEGSKYQQATFGLPASGGWAGLFIQIGPFGSNTTTDMSALATTGSVRFMIRSKHEIEIGVRTQNIGPGAERSKLLLRKSGLAKLDGTWESVAIPLSRFKTLDSRLDFAQAKVMFGAAVTNAFVTASSGTFDFDHVRWSN